MNTDFESLSGFESRIIHLEDDLMDRELAVEMLNLGGIKCEMIYADDLDTFKKALEEDVHLIISDFSLPSYDGVRALELARELRSSVPFIFFSGTLGEEAAIKSLKQGATDYVLKQHPDRLVSAVRWALLEARQRTARHHAEEELRKRDLLLRQIMLNTDDLIAVADLNGRLLISSSSHDKYYGEITHGTGIDFLAEVLPEDRDRVHAAFQEAAQLGAKRRIEYRLKSVDVGIRYMEASANIIRGESGESNYILWVAHDITERRLAEEKIREQAALLSEARDAICVNDLNQTIIFWNRSAEKLYGWSAKEAIGRNANELLFQEKDALAAMKMLIQRGEWNGELRQTNRSGNRLLVESRWTLIRDNNGNPKSILVINTDVTQRRKNEEKIRQQAALLDKAQDAIFVCDLEGTITYWNDGATRLYGWQPEEAVGQRTDILSLKKSENNIAGNPDDVFTKGEWFGELEHLTRSGTQVIVQSRQTLVSDADGGASSILCINSDITEKKQIETRFLRTQRMENLGALAGGIAHDLNNILAPIMMAAEMIREPVAGISTSGLVDTITLSAKRGSDLVNQILSFTRGAKGEMVPLGFRNVVSEVIKLSHDTFPRTIELKTTVAANLPAILGDPTRLHQVLLNLLVNARDAMPAGGVISITAEAVQLSGKATHMQPGVLSGPFLAIKVADTGDGIPPEVQSKIFEPFFTTKDPGHGTGLGLSTVASIVKSHGGFIEFSSEPGRGTTFILYFPALQKANTPETESKPARPPHGTGQCILVVDDEKAIVEITSLTLSAYNYKVLIAGNGNEAVEIFTKQHADIDLVLTDMMMPAMDGATMINAFLKIKPDQKIIAISGLINPAKDNELKENGVKAFLRKPFTTDTLLKTLDSVLNGKPV